MLFTAMYSPSQTESYSRSGRAGFYSRVRPGYQTRPQEPIYESTMHGNGRRCRTPDRLVPPETSTVTGLSTQSPSPIAGIASHGRMDMRADDWMIRGSQNRGSRDHRLTKPVIAP